MDRSVCPWCHTEIVWDEETGPEEECPHCLNELGAYRSVELGEVVIDTEEESKSAVEAAREATEVKVQSAEAEIELPDDPDSVYNYEEKVAELQEKQSDIVECQECHETMLSLGNAMIEGNSFIAGSLAVHAFVCPFCFQVKWNLADESRLSMIHQLSQP